MEVFMLLEFTQSLNIAGLPPEAEGEWKGLCVRPAPRFPTSIGCLAIGPARIWDPALRVYRFDGPFAHDPEKYRKSLQDEYYWVSRQALIEACTQASPPRTHILSWLKSLEESQFEFFRVCKEVAEYTA